MSYQKLVTFGSSLVNDLPVYDNDPMTLCLGTDINQPFNHGSNGSIYGQNSPECQIYMSQRCAKNWDGLCEYAANDKLNPPEYAIRADTLGQGMNGIIGLSPSDILVRNTAMEKYRISMNGGENCTLKTEQFDPINPSSPYMSYYVGYGCVPELAVDTFTIDDDPVMNKLLDNPKIGMQILVNIYNTMRRKGTLSALKGTRLGNFYESGLKEIITRQHPIRRLGTEEVKQPIDESIGLFPASSPSLSRLVPIQIDGLGLPGTSDYYPYSLGLGNYVDYWPTNGYRAGIPYFS